MEQTQKTSTKTITNLLDGHPGVKDVPVKNGEHLMVDNSTWWEDLEMELQRIERATLPYSEGLPQCLICGEYQSNNLFCERCVPREL